jgi:hypothetical protein
VSIPRIVFELLQVVGDLLKGAGDSAAEEEALMRAQESLKAELDRRKFGG